jgi:hypothetical protein|tara:strand:+ start:3111 stop:3371 length:261 start_codon:yes stop_codon:yes gene_type:complete
LEALLRLIFIVIIIYYGFRLFFRYAVPWLLARFMRKQQEKYANMSGFGKQQQNSKSEDVNFKEASDIRNNNDKDFGEYVDFEDVED